MGEVHSKQNRSLFYRSALRADFGRYRSSVRFGHDVFQSRIRRQADGAVAFFGWSTRRSRPGSAIAGESDGCPGTGIDCRSTCGSRRGRCSSRTDDGGRAQDHRHTTPAKTGDDTDMLVSAAYLTAREIKLDPLLILAVMAIESRFNPFAESPMGAQGLMQVMSKVHHDKFQELGGVKAALNPVANIKVGSLILKEC